MGFTKLDDGLIFSSILTEDDAVFKVWVLILSRTGKDGVAPISPAFLASVCRKDDAEIERCLAVLAAPDHASRSLNDDGRRIERVDGGFRVINYQKYRERAESEEVRAYEREKKRRQRESGREPVPVVSRTESGRSASASPSVVVVGEGSGEREDDRGARLLHESRVAKERRFYALISRLSELQPEKDPPDIAREVTSYKAKDGRQVRGVVRPEGMTEERLDRSLEDAQWWIDDLTKPKEAASGKA